jgi:hypothetical protein
MKRTTNADRHEALARIQALSFALEVIGGMADRPDDVSGHLYHLNSLLAEQCESLRESASYPQPPDDLERGICFPCPRSHN